MNKIIDNQKDAYNEFKLFKNLYTRIKISSKVYLIGEDNKVKIIFSKDNFFILIGEITAESEFINWIKDGKKVVLNMDDVKELKSCLKKQVVSVEFNEDNVIFKFLEKENNNEKTIIFNADGFSDNVLNIVNNINKSYDFIEKPVLEEWVNSEIIKLFIDNGKITQTRTTDKLIEIPVSKVYSIQPNSKINIFYASSRTKNGERYVKIESETDDLKLEQIFLTI